MDVIGIYLFIVGLFFGSFYNVVATRLPKNESIIKPGSHCENCKHRLTWYELIPVFSYIFLKGKCKKCKIKLSIQYPLVEILTGLLFMVSYLIFGVSYDTLISIVLVSLVILIFISDIKYYVILDEALIVAGVLLLVLLYLKGGFELLLTNTLYGVCLFIIMLVVKLSGDKVFKKESLGWGDVKLSLIAGMVLGLYLGTVYIFLGAFIALPYSILLCIKKGNGMIPFGPFLGVSLLIVYWNGTAINDFVLKLIGVE